jgi:Outer membrane protein beta-barrel domain
MRFIVTSSLLACMCIAAMFATSSPASAFGLTGFGGKLGYLTPEDLDGTMVVGAHLEFEQHDSRLHFIPSLMYWKANNLSDASANADFYYHFVREGLIAPYLGAGLGVNFFNNDGSNQSDTKLGANLFGGVRLPAPGHHYFFEGRYTASDVSQFSVLGGITFHGWGGR